MDFINAPTLHLVLDRPQIAGNVAAIVRLCAGTACALHICGPLLFDSKDTTKWRAGLDYFSGARVHFHQSLKRCLELLKKDPFILEVGGNQAPWEVSLSRETVVILGPETGNVQEWAIRAYKDRLLTLPQPGPVRSLNLAQCAAVIAFEALRQQSIK